MMAAAASALLCACANIGHPEGGPRDVTPPVFVGSTPKLYELNCKKNKIELQFDEIVQLKDQSKKVVVSPVQHEAPKVSALGKKVTIELRDTLKPNTTYTIDFSDAIEDNNEGNPLNDFAFAFSTGDSIDSLQISGMVLEGERP
jgi:ABC-type oligopeptide transport system substrate-binding subunit